MTSPAPGSEKPFSGCVWILTTSLHGHPRTSISRQLSLLGLPSWQHVEESHVCTWNFMAGPSDNDKQAAGKNIILERMNNLAAAAD